MTSLRFTGGLLVVIGLVFVAAGVAVGGPLFTLMPTGLLLLLCGAGTFWMGGWAGLNPGKLDTADLSRLGRPATATVLEVGAPSGGIGAETEVVLKVAPVNESTFKAKAQIASTAPTPRVGDQVRVKFDPSKRRRLIVTG